MSESIIDVVFFYTIIILFSIAFGMIIYAFFLIKSKFKDVEYDCFVESDIDCVKAHYKCDKCKFWRIVK